MNEIVPSRHDEDTLAVSTTNELAVSTTNELAIISELKDKILGDFALSACKDEMAAVLSKKVKEMEEADITSSKDVSEIIASMHKMRMEELKLEVKLAELEIKRAALNKPTINNTQLNVGNDALKGLPGVLRSILSS